MKKLTKQDVLDKLVTHFIYNRKQPGLSHSGKVCRYRSNTNAKSPTRCAVGICIPKKLYNPTWDTGSGLGVRALIVGNSNVQDLFDIEYAELGNFLGEVQGCHDITARAAKGNLPKFRESFYARLKQCIKNSPYLFQGLTLLPFEKETK